MFYFSFLNWILTTFTFGFMSGMLSLPVSASQPADKRLMEKNPCVQIYYDRRPQLNPIYTQGRMHTVFLQNLLGHFPKYQQVIVPIEKYQKGDIERCDVSFYIGTYFENAIPEVFFEDFTSTQKKVIWLGYNISMLGQDRLAKLWDVRYNRLSTLDLKNLDSEGRPGFYRIFKYKGESFEKYGEWGKTDKTQFRAGYEIALFDFLKPEAEKNVLVWAEHNTQKDAKKAPYVLKKDNHWYVGDSPFTFVDESDRYVIFADLLFEMLGESGTHKSDKKRALIRLEDIHPRLPLWQLYQLTDLLAEKKVPFVLSVIPIFRDPFGAFSNRIEDQFVPMSQREGFLEFLRYAKKKGASIVFHGVTHQSGERKNPFNGVSGDDFEFWDRVNNGPIENDSPEFVIQRLEQGLSLFNLANITPQVWMTPHYQASPLDYSLFSQLFSWNIGRVIYFPFVKINKPDFPEALSINRAGVAGNGKRLPLLAATTADWNHDLAPTGQFFPYEIYGDIYGQRLIPENIGNLQPFINEQVHKSQGLDDMAESLKRNSVLHSDFWGSYFIHTYFLGNRREGGLGDFPGDPQAFIRVVEDTRKLGYEFIDLDHWQNQNRGVIRPEPIEVD